MFFTLQSMIMGYNTICLKEIFVCPQEGPAFFRSFPLFLRHLRAMSSRWRQSLPFAARVAQRAD